MEAGKDVWEVAPSGPRTGKPYTSWTIVAVNPTTSQTTWIAIMLRPHHIICGVDFTARAAACSSIMEATEWE